MSASRLKYFQSFLWLASAVQPRTIIKRMWRVDELIWLRPEPQTLG